MVFKLKTKSIHYLILLQIAFILSSCASFDGLRFWKSDEINPDEPRELISFSEKRDIVLTWKNSFNGINEIGNFVPAFSSGNIYFSDTQGNVSSISAIDGSKNWESKLDLLASGTAAGFDIVVISDEKGNVIALNIDDGSMLWSTNLKSEILSSAAIDAKGVIVKTGAGELFSLDKQTGEILWSYRSKLPTLTIRGSSSPIIFDNKVYVSFDNGRLGVFEISSGFPLWDGAISYVSGSSELENLIDADSNPVISGGLIYTTNYQGKLNIFDIAQKRSIWSYDISSFFSPVISRGMIVVVESNSAIKSFTSKNLEESWVIEDYINRQISNAISFKGNLIIGDFEGYIHIINPLNGKTIGREKISRNPIKTIISRSDSFYVVDEEFNLFSLNI
ncbi:MAG: outer membrane protein assembly factor BamB [Gammaproteobacteria bacterium]|nr:outer membrane protein assembly factor BamB [Gammaproteobacteria bacterium]